MEDYKGIFIPEVEIYNIISILVSTIREDLLNNNNEQDTFLFKIFQDKKAGEYNFFEQSKELFGRLGDDPKELKVRMFFDASRAEIPTIHINLPSESTLHNGLGTDQNFQDFEIDDIENEYINNFTRTFNSNYQVVFTSANSLEVVLLYHSIRAAFIQLIPALSVYGLQNISLSGQDIFLNPDIVPPTVFVRSFSINFGYDVTVPSFEKNKFYTDVFAKITFQKD